MRGLSAITAANGWMTTLAGLSIVFVGLCVLAVFLTYLVSLLAWWDKLVERLKTPRHRPEIQAPQVTAAAPSGEAAAPASLPKEIVLGPEALEAYHAFKLLTQREGQAFSLSKLIEQAEKRGLPRPHYHLNQFLLQGLIEELSGEDQGFYRWASSLVVRSEETIHAST
ncbi:hypothetical protein [Desulfosoma caldarium]|uniref:Oxaloacetate decarboxylase gamma subunit n=1 Tax=Desulfosoma caldarium TaxID=610254 RepID=A0A3N1UQU4_9BACT|nr:hypothetical protein [Desulfosoma caldarium]ROQ93474.1 oxaloacetate decarboxylase gamma subunit [Desulfosoma caldarium]